MRIIRKLDKESLIYCYPIYTIDTWSMLTINNPTLMELINEWNLVLGLTQENLIENFIQNCLPYIYTKRP